MDPELDKINFSNQRTAIPFGKFETVQDDVFPCNESMIGREGARSKLIDFLINAGTRKAILVTGRRGMGKTSFVQYCLNEYEEARIERFWHSNFGRSAFSLMWLIVISFVVVGSFLIGGRLLQILLYDFKEHRELILLLPLGLLISCLTYPVLLAGKILMKLINQFISIPSIFVILMVALIFITLGIIDNWLDKTIFPSLYLEVLLITLAVVYSVGEYLNFLSPKKRLVNSFFLIIVSFIISVACITMNNYADSSYLTLVFPIVLMGIYSRICILKRNRDELKKSILVLTISKSINRSIDQSI